MASKKRPFVRNIIISVDSQSDTHSSYTQISDIHHVILGPDYMANFSLVSRAETSARVLKEILLK